MSMVAVTSPAKILLIPASYYSQVNSFALAAKTLKDGGHDVTVLVHDQHADRVTKMHVSALKYSLPEDAVVPTVLNQLMHIRNSSDMNIFYKGYSIYNTAKSSVDKFCQTLLGNKRIMDEIRDAKFDLAIVDLVPFLGCIHYIPYKFDIPRINLGFFEKPWRYGVSSVPFHEPPVIVESKTRHITLRQRVIALIGGIVFEYIMPELFSFTKHATVYLPEKPLKTVAELTNESEMTFITVETTCFDFPKISAPHYRFIGSLSGSVTPKPLTGEYKTFVDGAKDGLIVISFGSLIEMRKTIIGPIGMLIEALGRMKEKAVVQFTQTDLGNLKIPPNVLVREWLPQTDLLAHQNAKLFIGHGGMNGHLEATYLGIPILTLPYQSEQAHNGARAEAKGYGKLLKWDEINTHEIYDTIRELIDNKNYKENIVKCMKIIKDMPSAREQLSFWVNHILKHGSKHLRPIAADMPFYQFFGLDVFVLLVTVIFVVIVLFCTCCKYCCCRCCRSSKLKKD